MLQSSPNTVIGFKSFMTAESLRVILIHKEQFIYIYIIVVGKQIIAKLSSALTARAYQEKPCRFPIEVYVRMQ